MSKTKEEKYLDILRKNINHLHYRLARYKIMGVAPPVNLLRETKMAENLFMIEALDLMHVDVKV